MFEPKIFDGIPYRVWNGLPLKFSKYPNLGHTELSVRPNNLLKIADRAAELHKIINYDTLRFDSADGDNFETKINLQLLAPFVEKLVVEQNCRKIEFGQFVCLSNLLELQISVKPKNLFLSEFPKLWRAALGKIDNPAVLEGSASLEKLVLAQRLDIAKTGWEWLATLPKLKKFEMIQFEIASLVGITPNPSIETLGIAYPRTFVSFEGIEVFSNLKELEIEGAKQISDLSPIGDLKNLKNLDIISSAKPKSWEFLKKLPNLEWAAFDGDMVWENGEFTKKSLKLVAP